MTTSLHALFSLFILAIVSSAHGQLVIQTSPRNSAPGGGGTITITGNAFGGNYSPTAYVTIDGVDNMCTTSGWNSFTSVFCQVPAGYGQSHTVKVKAVGSALERSVENYFSYDPPVTTVVAGTSNAPTTGSAVLTIGGMNFVGTDRTATVSYGLTACATTSWLSSSALACVSPVGVGASLALTSTVASISGALTATVAYDAAAITVVANANVPSSSSSSVTLSGFNFGVTDVTISVTLGSSTCATLSWASLTAISCLPANGAGENLDIVTNVYGNRGSLAKGFSYDAPAVSYSLGANTASSSGSSVTLLGFNFASADPTATASTGVTACGTTSWSSASSVQCLPSYGAVEAPFRLGLMISGVTSTLSGAFTFDSPVVSYSQDVNAPACGTTSVTLTGFNFAAANPTISVMLGSTACSTSTWTTGTSVVCQVGSGVPFDTVSPMAAIGTGVGTRFVAFTFDSPAISILEPTNAPTCAGSLLTIQGFNFGQFDSSATASFVGMQHSGWGGGSTDAEHCATTAFVSGTSLLCFHNGGRGPSVSVLLSMGGKAYRATNIFSFDSPSVTFAGPTNAPSTTGASLTVLGFNFGKNDVSLTASIGTSSCPTAAWSSYTSVQCKTPEGTNTALDITTEVRSLVGTLQQFFTYDAPTMTSGQTPNVPSSGSASATTITGMNFATDDKTMSVTIGGTMCITTSWTSATSTQCFSPVGTGKGLTAVLKVDGLTHTEASYFTYSSPVLSMAATPNAPTSLGGSVTILGFEFGASDTTVSLRVGSTLCQTSAWVTGTSVVCEAPIGTGKALALALTVSDVIGTAAAGFSFDAPVVSITNLFNAAKSGGASMTISGFNFGTVDVTETVRVGGTLCLTTSWTTGTSLTCQSAPGVVKQPRVEVNTGDLSGTQTRVFSYDAPVVTDSLARNAPSTVGTVLSVVGTNFAMEDASPTVNVGLKTNSIATTQCSTASWTSSTAVTCTIGVNGKGAGHMISVLLSSEGTKENAFTYDAPVVTSSKPTNTATTSTQAVTVHGTSFYPVNYSQSVSVGATACSSSSWVSATAVVCGVNPGLGPMASVTVTAVTSEFVGTNFQSFTYDPPVMTAAIPYNAPASKGASVSVQGFNFGIVDPTASLRLGASLCSTSSWTSVTQVLCVAPEGYGAAHQISATVASLVSTVTAAFTFDAPVVSLVNPKNAPSSVGASMSITGMNFGLPSVASIGSTACATTSWQTGSSVKCLSADGMRVGHSARVETFMLQGTVSMTMTYDAPVLSSFNVPNAPMTGASSMTVHGTAFGVADATPTLQMAQTMCTSTSWVTTTSIVCAGSPPGINNGATTDGFIYATVGAIVGSSMMVFTFDTPVLTMLNAPNAPVSSATSMTVLGLNFGQQDFTNSVIIDVTRCPTASWQSATAVKCLVPIGSGKEHTAFMTVGTKVGTMVSSFTYDAPIVSTSQHHNGPTTTGTSVTIGGSNFGYTDPTTTAGIGGAPCSTSAWTSMSAVICKSPSWAGIQQAVAVSVTDHVGSRAAVFTFDAPILTYNALVNGPSTAGAMLTVEGTNFGAMDFSNTVRVGKSNCAATHWVSSSSVKCITPDGSGASMSIGTTVSLAAGTMLQTFSFDTPVISQLQRPNSPISGGTSVTLHGHNFGTQDETTSSRIGETACTKSTWTSTTTVVCTADRGIGNGVTAVSTVASLVSTLLNKFSYDSPVVTFVNRMNGPTCNGASVTIHGVNFGVRNLTPTVQIGKSLCTTSSWKSTTSIICLHASGHGTTPLVAVTVGKNVGTQTAVFTYDSPTVTFLNKFNSPTTSGSSITVLGHNFGSEDLSPTVQIGNTVCITTSWATTTSVRCLSPYGTGTEHRAAVSVGGMVGTKELTFTYNAPVVTFIQVFNAPTTSGAGVTMLGNNFGKMNTSPTAQIGQTTCASTSWTTHTAVKCRAPVGSGLDLPVSVEVTGLKGATTQTIRFTYDPPVVTHALIYNGPTTGGQIVTVSGYNLGPSELDGPKVSLGKSRCSATSWISPTSLVCKGGAGIGHRQQVTSELSGLIGTMVFAYTFDAPILMEIAVPNGPTSGSASVTIIGTNFGVAPQQGTIATAGLGATSCQTMSWRSTSSLICRSNTGTGRARHTTVVMDGVIGTMVSSFTYDSPVVTFVAIANGPTGVGAHVTVLGTNFGTSDTSTPNMIRLGKFPCATTTWVSVSQIFCVSGPGAGAGLSVAVTIDGVVGTIESTFSYDAPVIRAVTQANGATSGGATITVVGMNLGQTDMSSTVRVGASDCQKSIWVSPTSLACVVPDGFAAAGISGMNVNAIVGGVFGTFQKSFTFDSPVLTYANRPNGPTTAGSTVTINGANFASTDTTVSARIGKTACIKSSWVSSTTVLCVNPIGTGARLSIALEVANLKGMAPDAFTYNAPVVTLLASPNGPTYGSASITIQGSNFGVTDQSPTARIGSTRCLTTSWMSDNLMHCQVAEGYSIARDLVATVDGLSGLGDRIFSYDCPVVLSAVTTNVPMHGGSLVTISGSNFGQNNFMPTAFIGPTFCTKTQWVSPNTITCVTPPGGSSLLTNLDITVALGGCGGALEGVMFFDGADRFDPFATMPVQEGYELAYERFLSCEPDYTRPFSGKALADAASLVVEHGVTGGEGGVSVASTGIGSSNDRLFSMPLGYFLWDAVYTLSLTVEGDFNIVDNVDFIFGVGDGTNFMGFNKPDRNQAEHGTFIQGTYGSVLDIATVGSGRLWSVIPGTTPTTATFTLRAKASGKLVDLTFVHGGTTTSIENQNNFLQSATGATSMNLEMVAFRKQKDQIIRVSKVTAALSGCAEAGASAVVNL